MKHKLFKTTLATAVIAAFVSVPLQVQAANVFKSSYSQPMEGYMPYFPSVGALLYKAENPVTPYDATENSGQKSGVKVGDIVRVPTYLKDDAYTKFYSFMDKDGDIEDKKNINLSFEWYILKEGAETIDQNTIVKKLTISDGVSGNPAQLGQTYVVGPDAVGKQIGFKIIAKTTYGNPMEGIALDVPNIAFLGMQEQGTDPTQPPVNVIPDPNNPDHKNPNIDDTPVAPGNKYIVEILDKRTNQLVGGDRVFVDSEYQAVVKKFNDVTNEYEATNEVNKYITWSLYLTDAKGHTAKAQYMTKEGYMQVPQDEAGLIAFDPDSADFTPDASVTASFSAGDNTVFKTQAKNENSIELLKDLPPNYSEQGLNLKVELVLPNNM